MIKVEHLSHSYNKKENVLTDINLHLDGKGITGFLGSNGAGKSTLMNIISGIINPLEGRVLINGYDLMKERGEALKYIGYLPQKPPVYENLTVYENIKFAASLKGVVNLDDAVEQIMESIDITHFRNRLVRNLSGGYKQRVGIAQAVVHKPKIIILDEPLNGLDPNNIIEIRSLIVELSKSSLVFLSTHILSEAEAICNHIVMIEQGRLLFNSTLADFVRKASLNSFVIRFYERLDCDELSLKMNQAISTLDSRESFSVKPIGNSSLDSNTIEILSPKGPFDKNKIIDFLLKNDYKIDEVYNKSLKLEDVYKILSKSKSHI